MTYSSCARAILILATASGVADVESARTGPMQLAIDAPPGFEATRSEDPYSTDEQIDIRGETGLVCRALFARREAPASSATIARMTASEAWRSDLKQKMELVFDEVEVTRFEADGITGAVALGSDQADDYANIFYSFETAPGRTTLFCIGSSGQLKAERQSIDELAQSLRIPRDAS